MIVTQHSSLVGQEITEKDFRFSPTSLAENNLRQIMTSDKSGAVILAQHPSHICEEAPQGIFSLSPLFLITTHQSG